MKYEVNSFDIESRVNQLMSDGVLSLVIEEIKKDIAFRIVQTEPNAGALREELYMFVKALNGLETKLQEYVNKESQETE